MKKLTVALLTLAVLAAPFTTLNAGAATVLVKHHKHHKHHAHHHKKKK
jgi:Ni/Co efflux regulator RcnB